jgi:hypothetical protein
VNTSDVTQPRLCIRIGGLTVIAFLFHATLFAQGMITVAIQGAQVETDSDGNWSRLYATGVSPVDFPDSRGIASARVVAEETAKSQLVRFVEQQSSAETIIEELETTESNTLRVQGTADSVFSTEARRTISTQISNIKRSSAAGTLRGVTVFETGYDQDRGEVWVQVGYTPFSINAAASIESDLNRPAVPSRGNTSQTVPTPADRRSTPINEPGSFVSTGRTPPASASPGTQSTATNETVATRSRGFTVARAFVRGLKLYNQAEWDAYVNSGEKPVDIPSEPALVYEQLGWVSWDNWLGVVR